MDFYHKYVKYKLKYLRQRKKMSLLGMKYSKHQFGGGNLTLLSEAFMDGEEIPKEYTCDGANIPPPLYWENVPPNTESLALIMDDPDAPNGTWVHWVIWNINKNYKYINKNYKVGKNSWNENNYGGPCPPRGTGAHRYFFKLYALDTLLELPDNTNKEKLLKAMEGHIIAHATLIGTYSKK